MRRWKHEVMVSSVVLMGILGTGSSLWAAGGAPADFNADGRTDRAFFRPADGTWHWRPSREDGGEGPEQVRWWGSLGDTPLAGDFDGDGMVDPAIFRPSTQTWWIEPSSGQAPMIVGAWGLEADRPVPADYDGDGRTDLAVFRPADSEWWIHRSDDGGHHVDTFGQTGDLPVVADCDGDGRADLAIARPDHSWWIAFSSGIASESFVVSSSGVSVPADYDGDGVTDPATYDPETGLWSILESTTRRIREESIAYRNGDTVTGGRPVPGRYDGDLQADLAVVIRGQWIVKSSKGGGQGPENFFPDNFGTDDDIPVPWLALSGAPR